ncbi:hypothetical protein SMICM304S_05186 [Streptomyces microflavus]
MRTYALRNTENRELLDFYREAAIEAADDLVRAAATADTQPLSRRSGPRCCHTGAAVEPHQGEFD